MVANDHCSLVHGGDRVWVSFLLENGASPHAGTSWGTPLTKAAGKGHLRVAQALVEGGANIDGLDEEGRPISRFGSPLVTAAEENQIGMAGDVFLVTFARTLGVMLMPLLGGAAFERVALPLTISSSSTPTCHVNSRFNLWDETSCRARWRAVIRPTFSSVAELM
jgi:hypothetical protein